jgi:hypothetical protein
MKLLDVRWFCGATNVAIVRAEDPYDGIQYFISQVTGSDEAGDAVYAMNWGTRFPNDAGDCLFGIK